MEVREWISEWALVNVSERADWPLPWVYRHVGRRKISASFSIDIILDHNNSYICENSLFYLSTWRQISPVYICFILVYNLLPYSVVSFVPCLLHFSAEVEYFRQWGVCSILEKRNCRSLQKVRFVSMFSLQPVNKLYQELIFGEWELILQGSLQTL